MSGQSKPLQQKEKKLQGLKLEIKKFIIRATSRLSGMGSSTFLQTSLFSVPWPPSLESEQNSAAKKSYLLGRSLHLCSTCYRFL
jgi:hypothetical protein